MSTVFARGVSSPIGKCDEPMKTFVPLDVRLRFQEVARSLGASEAELLRDAVFKLAYGVTYVKHCANLRASVFSDPVHKPDLNRDVGGPDAAAKGES